MTAFVMTRIPEAKTNKSQALVYVTTFFEISAELFRRLYRVMKICKYGNIS